MAARREIAKKFARLHTKAGKTEKGRLLDAAGRNHRLGQGPRLPHDPTSRSSSRARACPAAHNPSTQVFLRRAGGTPGGVAALGAAMREVPCPDHGRHTGASGQVQRARQSRRAGQLAGANVSRGPTSQRCQLRSQTAVGERGGCFQPQSEIKPPPNSAAVKGDSSCNLWASKQVGYETVCRPDCLPMSIPIGMSMLEGDCNWESWPMQ